MVEISKGWGAFPFSVVWWHGIVYVATRLTGLRHEYKLAIPNNIKKIVKLLVLPSLGSARFWLGLAQLVSFSKKLAFKRFDITSFFCQNLVKIALENA